MRAAATSILLAVALALATAGGCGGDDRSVGADVFEDAGCARCHRLDAAGSKGGIGPNLDEVRPTVQEVLWRVNRGGGGMPNFAKRLKEAEKRAVADYIADATDAADAAVPPR